MSDVPKEKRQLDHQKFIIASSKQRSAVQCVRRMLNVPCFLISSPTAVCSPGRDECFVVCSSSLILISGLLSLISAMARPTSLILCLVTAQLAGEKEEALRRIADKNYSNGSIQMQVQMSVSFHSVMLQDRPRASSCPACCGGLWSGGGWRPGRGCRGTPSPRGQQAASSTTSAGSRTR